MTASHCFAEQHPCKVSLTSWWGCGFAACLPLQALAQHRERGPHIPWRNTIAEPQRLQTDAPAGTQIGRVTWIVHCIFSDSKHHSKMACSLYHIHIQHSSSDTAVQRRVRSHPYEVCSLKPLSHVWCCSNCVCWCYRCCRRCWTCCGSMRATTTGKQPDSAACAARRCCCFGNVALRYEHLQMHGLCMSCSWWWFYPVYAPTVSCEVCLTCHNDWMLLPLLLLLLPACCPVLLPCRSCAAGSL